MSPSPSPSPSGSGAVALGQFEAAGIRATRVVPAMDGDRRLDVRGYDGTVLAAGGNLVSFTTDRYSQGRRLAWSADLGKVWHDADLPGASEETFPQLSETGTGLAAVGNVNRAPYVWVSSDGAAWRGGPVGVGPEGYHSDYPKQQPDGRLAAGTQRTPNGERLVVSDDGGATWRMVDCPPASRPAAKPAECRLVRLTGGNLWVRASEVSLDAGRSWQTLSIATDPASVIYPLLESAVALPGGGWLGAVNVIHQGNDPFFAYLARSTDGTRWERILPSPCDKGEKAGATASEPRALGDRWLVAYTCTTNGDTPARSLLLLVGRDGTGPTLLASVEGAGRSFGQPLSVGDAVVVPEFQGYRGVGGTVSFLHLRA